MATTVEPREGAQPYVDADEYIDFQLAKTQSQIKTTEVLTSASWLGIAVLSYVLTFVILDQWIMPGGFSNWARAVWLGGLVCGGGGWLIWRILLPWFRTIHELYAAKMIESADPTLKSSLLNLIDLQLHGKESLSPLVKVSMEKRAAVELSKVDVDHAVNHQSLLRLAYVLLAVLVVCSLYVMLSPKDAFSSVQRLLLPASQMQVATQTTIANVTPEDTKVLAGELLTVEADILGQSPPQVTLVYTTEDREFVDQPVDMQRLEDGVSRYRGVISGEKGRGLMQSISYRIEAGDARTRDFQVQVVEPPSSKVETVAYAFPSYMRLDPKTQLGGHIDGWEGTKVVVTAVTNIPVASALLVMTDTENPQAKGEEIRMTVRDGTTLTAEWTLGFRSDGTFARYYHIDCTTAAGESDPQPVVYAIKIQPDQRPDVALLHPTQDLERPANAVIPLLVKAADPDFQLRFVTLRIEKGGEEIHSASLLDEERQTFEGTHDLQLDKLTATGLKPGDELLYWIEARDNKQPNGNRSTTPRLKIKISSPAKAEELAQQLEQDRQRQQEQLEQANPDRNPNPEEPGEPEADPNQAQRPQQPGEQKPEAKPGEPKPAEDPANPDEPKNNDPENPGQPQPRPDKPEAGPSKQPGQPGDKQQKKPGNKAERQPGEQQPGAANSEKSPDGQKGPPDKSTDDKPDASNERGEGGEPGSKPRNKRGPADDQTALQKLLQRQQENPEATPDEPENDSRPEDNSDQQQPGTGKGPKTPSERPMPSKTEKPRQENEDDKSASDSDPGQSEKPEKSSPKSDKAKSQPGTEKSKSGSNQTENKPGEKSQNQPSPTEKKNGNQGGGEEKSPTEKTPTEKTPGETPMPNEGAPPDKSEKPGKPASKSNAPRENDPNGKSMKKDADGNPEPGQPQDKSAQKPSEKTAEGTPQTGADAKKPGEKEPTEKTAKSANNQAGKAAEEGGKENSPEQKGTGAGKKATDEERPDSETTQKGPGTGQKPGSKKEPGSAPTKPGSEESPEKMPGEETPAEEGPDAVKKKATGEEKGAAKGQEKPDSEKAPRARNDLDREPNTKPGAMRKSDDPREPGTKGERGSKDPDATKAKPDGSERIEEPMKGTNKKSDQPAEKRPGSDPSQNEPNPGAGQKNQKSKQADTGEGGGNTPQDQGTPGSKQKGTGDTQKQSGDQAPAEKKQGGQPGSKEGEGSKTRPAEKGNQTPQEGGNQPGKNDPMPGGEGEQKPGEQPGQPKAGEGQPGKGGQPMGAAPKGGQPPQGGRPGKGTGAGGAPGEGGLNPDQPGDQEGNGPGEPDGQRRNLPPAEQDQAAQEAEEKANEEFARKASNLVLKKLRKELDRGEVDQQLLDELGWTKEDMEKFVKRLESQLQDPGEDDSPEAAARRRQFEETLKTLGLSAKTRKRAVASGKTTRVNEIGTRKVAPPPEYQELFEEYTKELAKPTNSPAKNP